MTDKELRKLSRTELLQLLLDQAKETERLQSSVKELTEQIQRHEITCQNAGSIAEAALALSGVFQAADQAAQKYIQEVEERASRQDAELQAKNQEAQEKVNRMLAEATDDADRVREEGAACLKDAQARADAILAEAEAAASKVREEADICLTNARDQAEEILNKAKEDADEYWNKVNDQIQILLQGQETLQKLFQAVGKK